jgi:hypothetical protein
MRDIRSDLKERLESVSKERQSLQSRLAELDQIEAGIKALLAREDQRLSMGIAVVGPAHPADNHIPTGGTPLATFILKTAYQGSKRWLMLGDFKRAAEEAQFDFGEKSPGRTLHRALVGLTTNGYLECHGSHKDRKYRIVKEEEKERAVN